MQPIVFSTDDHSRVLLEKKGDSNSDYINASYIPVSFIPLIFRYPQHFDDVIFLGKLKSPTLILLLLENSPKKIRALIV